MAAGAAVGAGLADKKAEAAKETAGPSDPMKTRSYNENMEYRRLGRTELWISALSIGGHWKALTADHRSLTEGPKSTE